jgi:hypothetical protein
MFSRYAFCFGMRRTVQFCEWMVSKDGQLVVEGLGYFPLPAEKRQEAMRVLSTTTSQGQ